MREPYVQLLVEDRVVRTLPLAVGALRIGRAPESGLVLEDPSVSRVHAELFRVGERLELRDLGSANGCTVNGERVRGSVPIAPGDEIGIGGHRLVVRLESDRAGPWDGGEGEAVAGGLDEVVDREFAGLEALGEAASDAVLPASARDYDVVAEEEPEVRDLHAGLVVLREGRLDRIVGWDRDRICVGRAPECDLVLDAASVSRRHALLVREGDRFEVRDLESANGTHVNGRPVSRAVLGADDRVSVGDFELTLLLDTSPIDAAVVVAAAGGVVADAGESRFDMTVVGRDPLSAATGSGFPGADSGRAEAEPEPLADSAVAVGAWPGGSASAVGPTPAEAVGAGGALGVDPALEERPGGAFPARSADARFPAQEPRRPSWDPPPGVSEALEAEALEASPFDAGLELGEVLAEEDKPLEPSEGGGELGLARASAPGCAPSSGERGPGVARRGGEPPVRLEVRLPAEGLPAALRAWLEEEGEVRLAAEVTLRLAGARVRD